jgi:hypothetical protein
MTSALQCRHQHSYRLSAYERKANDFYPTPSDVAVGLALELPRLGLDLPRVALDPCGGDGALRRSLTPFGVDVRLSDLYPDKYPGADGYVTNRALDASDPEHLTHAFRLASAGCTAALFRSIWGAEPGRLAYLNRPSFFGEILCCWRPRWIAGSQGSPMHAYAWYVWRKKPRSGPR